MNSRVKLSEKAHAYLQEKRFAVLATLNEDGTPQLTTMWYLLEDDGTILMNTKVGRAKERNMRRDPRISVCVEDGYIYVTLSGKVEMIDDPEIAQRDIFRLSSRYHGEEKAKRQMENQFSKEQRVTLRLKPEHIIEYF
ncbi:MAG: PPOX class F420-dependent oxidoreductase [Chloroflexi bacterium]|nr:MAG: PPOX class F420-dependent oxidoreductase [Chloroflexota bacterium]